MPKQCKLEINGNKIFPGDYRWCLCKAPLRDVALPVCYCSPAPARARTYRISPTTGSFHTEFPSLESCLLFSHRQSLGQFTSQLVFIIPFDPRMTWEFILLLWCLFCTSATGDGVGNQSLPARSANMNSGEMGVDVLQERCWKICNFNQLTQSEAPWHGARWWRTGHKLFCKTWGFTSAMTPGHL